MAVAKSFISRARYNSKLAVNKYRFRKLNPHNKVYAANLFPFGIVTVGKHSYGSLFVYSWGAENEYLKIGNFVSIAEGVKFILGGNHCLDSFSTYPFRVMFLGHEKEAWSKGPIVIEDDVWIGMDAIILSGVTIHQGAVIGAGSVVAADIPPYAIAVGNPAHIAKYRFSKDIIEQLLRINLEELLTFDFVKSHAELLYSKLDAEVLARLLD